MLFFDLAGFNSLRKSTEVCMRIGFGLLLLAFLAFGGTLFAQTDITGGAVSGVWHLADSPFRVHGTVQVEQGTTLVIEPGTEVLFDEYTALSIDGCLQAIGTETDSIRFHGENWYGIDVQGTSWDVDSTRIEYSVITGSVDCGICDNVAARLSVRRCRISENMGTEGAGICIYGATPYIADNLIINNQTGGNGGGIYISYNSTPLIARNRIIGNSCLDSGGGIGVANCVPLLYDNVIKNNAAGYVGGGIFLFNSSARIMGNRILNNNGCCGGGVGVWSGCVPHLIDNLICNNTGVSGGGLYSCNSNDILSINNTICYNYADCGGGYEIDTNIDLASYNCILWGNQALSAPEVSIGTNCDPYFTNCCIEGMYTNFGGPGFATYDTTHNQNMISDDPLFIEPSLGAGFEFTCPVTGWMLAEDSPCINAGILVDDLYLPYYDVFGFLRIAGGSVDIGASEWCNMTTRCEESAVTKSPVTIGNYPNPFNPRTTITFSIPAEGRVRIDIYNLRGQKITTLTDARMTQGSHSIDWDGKAATGSDVASGFYLCRLNTDSGTATRKLLLMR
jgi:hypothetical protein